MKNNQVLVQPDLFTVSNKATDICLARAKYLTEVLERKTYKAAINKHYKKCLKEYRHNFSDDQKVQLVHLKCRVTKIEIGFYLKVSFEGWDSLGLVYVNPAFRGFNYYSILVNHFEENSHDISVIELSKDDFEETQSLYKKWGYTETIKGLFPTSVGLAKEGIAEKLAALLNVTPLTSKKILYKRIYQKLLQIAEGCIGKFDIVCKLDEMQDVFNTFDNKEQIIDFCEYQLSKSTDENILLDGFLRDYLNAFNNLIAA